MSKKIVDLAKQVLEIEANAILGLQSKLNQDFITAVELISRCQGKVVTTGIGKSGYIARKIAATLSSTGTPSVYLHPAESGHGDLGIITTGDVVLAISYGGESFELNPVINYVSRKGISLIAMTSKKDSPLAKNAKAFLDISVSKEACPLELAPTASSTASLAMGDALAMAVMSEKGFTATDFREFHPGGALGFKLTKVEESMHAGSGFITVSPDTSIKTLVSQMSRAETRGAAAVVDSDGNLLGAVTDGDLRRRLENHPDPLAGAAQEMMTKNPRTIDAKEISEKALFLMEQFRINVLFVLDSTSAQPKKPVGVLHIQDLLRNKVR